MINFFNFHLIKLKLKKLIIILINYCIKRFSRIKSKTYRFKFITNNKIFPNNKNYSFNRIKSIYNNLKIKKVINNKYTNFNITKNYCIIFFCGLKEYIKKIKILFELFISFLSNKFSFIAKFLIFIKFLI